MVSQDDNTFIWFRVKYGPLEFKSLWSTERSKSYVPLKEALIFFLI